ncbi:Asp-tRNA(Asn)/Glu-tRNA(Gln) amidotransferase subunit GatA, partial [bacterium]|nr:Asp-tRNA(Asn)/Glu-tRNA(Gln) amidotransferase subunit GatA [bacterium]
MTDLYKYKIHELIPMLKSGEISLKEIEESLLKRILSEEKKVEAFITLPDDSTVSNVNNEIKNQGEGFLHGIPIAIKDNICTSSILTTCASKILSNFIPPYDAHVIKRLKENGATLWGKTNMDEFAMGSSTETSYFKLTKNPWDLERIPGGSSGGSAAAVASGMALAALGSDTGGSIRQPASLCGIVGLKPTYGRVSRYGLVAFAPSFDQIGPLTRDVKDAAIILKAIAGYDKRDSTSLKIGRAHEI